MTTPKNNINRKRTKTAINTILDEKTNTYLSKTEIKSIQELIKTSSKWDCVKRQGKNGLPAGDATEAFERLNDILKMHGIHVVPVGELECFIRSIGGHGPEWVNKVLEKYPNLNNAVYKEAREFIEEIL